MTRGPRRNTVPACKAKVALAAITSRDWRIPPP